MTHAIGLLLYKKRISYQILKQEFELTDAELDALRFELVHGERVAVDEDGEFLVWADTTPPRASAGSMRLSEATPI